MTKKLLLLLLTTLQIFTITAQTSTEQLKDDFIRTYNPDGYDGYKNALELRDQGLSLVASLKNGLNQNIGLTESLDPAAILHDFNQQIQNIESLEADFKKSTNSYDFNAGQSIGNNFNSGNYEQGLNEVFSFLGGLEGRNQAKRQAAAQKESLRRERDTKMTNAYWKAQDYNSQTILEYAKAAAFAESIAEEKHFHSYVTNLECFSESMKDNFRTTSTYWLTNNCTEPIKNTFSGLENTFVAKDVQYLNIAKRKYKRFKETGYEPYRDAAIAFTAAVADANPSANLFVQIGDYYVGKSNILALTNYLTAQSFDKNYFDNDGVEKLEFVKSQSEEEIREAIETDNKAYLNAFLKANLDKTISIEGKSILNYAIELDQPDAVQIILNKYTKNKSQEEILDKLKKTVMMAAIYDSPDIIKRIEELGIPIDFEMKGYRPIDVAEKSNSVLVFDYYIETLDDGPELFEKFKSTDSDIFKFKNLILMAGFLNPSSEHTQEIKKLIEVRNIMGPEKFKNEGFTNKKSYELAIFTIESFEKTKDELTNDITKKYNELASKSAKNKVIEALIEVNAYKAIMNILEEDPSTEKLVAKYDDFYKNILKSRAWDKAAEVGTKESFIKLLLNTNDEGTKLAAIKKIVNIKDVPVLIAAANEKNKCGFFDGNGNIAIPFEYDGVDPFYDGLALVKKEKVGFIDKTGEVKIPLQYKMAWSFYDGLALTMNEEKEFSSIDIHGNEVAKFGNIVVLFEGTSLFVVAENDKEYLMHRNGKMITDKYTFFENTQVSKSISSKAIMVKDPETGKVGFIDYNGKILVPTTYSGAIFNFSDDLFFVRKESNGKFGIVNSKNEELTKFIYDVYYHYNGKCFTPFGEAIVRIDGKRGYIDKNGNILNSLKPSIRGSEYINESKHGSSIKTLFSPSQKTNYGALSFLSVNMGISYFKNVKKRKTKYGIKIDDEEIIPANLVAIIGFSFDHIKLDLDGKVFYVNIQGDLVEHKE